MLLLPLRDVGIGNPEEEYNRLHRLFADGKLELCQKEAERSYQIFKEKQPLWAGKIELLEAVAMQHRDLYEDALRLLSTRSVPATDEEGKIDELNLKASALTYLGRFDEAELELTKADPLCAGKAYAICAQLLLAHGDYEIERNRNKAAKPFLLRSLALGQISGDRGLQSASLTNLAVAAMSDEHFEDSLDWSRQAYRIAIEDGSEDDEQRILGNEGWAYYGLGDPDRALKLFQRAAEIASRNGSSGSLVTWLTASGDVYSSKGQVHEAEASYLQAIALGRKLNSAGAIKDATLDLAEVYVDSGRLDDASRYAAEALALSRKSGNRVDLLYAHLIQGQIALKRGDWSSADALLHEVDASPDSQPSMKLVSERAIAELYEAQGKNDAALRAYRTALITFERNRSDQKTEEAQLPFVSNASRIYDGYIHFLVKLGKIDEALMAADQSRARTLAQGLGIEGTSGAPVNLRMTPVAVARKAGASLLIYWLGDKQSYLWVVTPDGTKLFPIAGKADIERRIARYRGALMGPEDPLSAGNADGRALYATLIGPAAELIKSQLAADRPVMVLAEGALCQLNFATLIAPPSENVKREHYWIEDATVISAPSLAMLAAAKPAKDASAGSLLLMGDAVSPDANYPQLAFAATEMHQIEKHFAPGKRVVFARESAVPRAYLESHPEKFAFIHFVSHGVASQTNPLDSAIILSRSGSGKGVSSDAESAQEARLQRGAEQEDASAASRSEAVRSGQEAEAGSMGDDSFKLYAHEIMQHPIDARLVTISACYGNGTVVYVGEGLVGLSWAFLHAGAHNAIGALWEASDRSTPMLMDSLYAGLEAGEPAEVALRKAQLELLHSKTNFRKPFYWAPFQIYTRM